MNSVNSRTDMGSNWVVFIFLCPFFLAIYTTSLNTSCHFKDLGALNGFLEGLNKPISGWDNNSNSDCCTWDGVHCEFVSPIRKEDPNMSLRVVSIKLVGKKLQGKLSKSLADLDHLRILNLSHNFLRNSLPMELFKLEHLQVLDLSSNKLCGNSTIEIKLPSLRHLDLSKNSLQGSINEDMCRTARNLQVLDLSMNYFTGKIPASISNCSLIEAVSFGSNFLEGNLPENLFRLPKLSHLDLQKNRFSGLLSLAFGNLSNIVEFDISWNAFSGIFPDAFYKLTKLQKFSAESNRFFGPLPSSLSSSPSISLLNFRNNSLSGPIQLNCSAMISLTTLILSSNSFTGPIPDNLSSCQLLTNLNLSRNKFTGQLPESFKNLASLSQLSLTNCSLQNLSAALTILQHCKNLTFLVLTNSFHNEILPADPNLSFNKLETLVIANCRLIGLVPAWLNGCTKMQILDLSWNQLSGAIPEFFSKLNLLFYLDLSNNMLSDRIPKALTMLQSLIFQNSVTSKEPSVGFHIFSKTNQSAGGLQYNHIWSFPPTLDLSSNFLTGPILVEFGNLKQLHVLNLKNNILSGHIPNSLSGMTNLELLDLSHNNLSGMIPTSFVKLNFLSKFSVAFNQLAGKIPTGGQFDTFPDSSFEGNSHLCRFLSKSCLVVEPGEDVGGNAFESLDGDDLEDSIIGLPFVFGGVTGFVIVFTICFLSGWVFPKEKAKNDIEITWERRRR